MSAKDKRFTLSIKDTPENREKIWQAIQMLEASDDPEDNALAKHLRSQFALPGVKP